MFKLARNFAALLLCIQMTQASIQVQAQIRQGDVGPLLKTAWDQSPEPYNTECPLIDAHQKKRMLAGCGAVAMAQLMAFYQWPPQGAGSHTDPYPPLPGTFLNANYSSHTYHWDKIIGKDPHALGQLLLDCGIAINTRYGAEASSFDATPVPGNGPGHNNVGEALEQYFGYYSGGEVIAPSDFNSMAAWYDRLLTEIDAGRPVLYVIIAKKDLEYQNGGKIPAVKKGATHVLGYSSD